MYGSYQAGFNSIKKHHETLKQISPVMYGVNDHGMRSSLHCRCYLYLSSSLKIEIAKISTRDDFFSLHYFWSYFSNHMDYVLWLVLHLMRRPVAIYIAVMRDSEGQVIEI